METGNGSGEERCRFCKDYKVLRELDRNVERECRAKDMLFIIDHEYKANLLIRTLRIWKDGRTPRKNHVSDYTTQGYKLRFCPECGKRIQGRGKR